MKSLLLLPLIGTLLGIRAARGVTHPCCLTIFFQRKMAMRIYFICFVIFILTSSLMPSSLLGQRATATISGTVTDPSGAVIPLVSVRTTNSGTGASQNVESDSQGRYRIAELPVGEYRVQVEKEGFQRVVRTGIVLTVGSENVVDFSLPLGQATETLSVEADVPAVNTTSAQLSTLIDQTQIRELPLNGRNIQ